MDGIDLRDWFAAHATESDIAFYNSLVEDGHKWMPLRTREAARYCFADAMLAAREVK